MNNWKDHLLYWGFGIGFLAVLFLLGEGCMRLIENSAIGEWKPGKEGAIILVFFCFVAIIVVNLWMNRKNL